MLADAHFLTEGRSFTFELPDGLSPEPQLYGIVTTDAPRNVTYRSFDLEDDPRSIPSLQHVFDVQVNGREISVFRSLDESSTRVAYWRLPGGWLQTFTDDRFRCGTDSDRAMRSLLARLVVTVRANGLPKVELRKPLRAGDLREPDQRESIVYAPPGAQGWPMVQLFREPTWVREGTSRWQHGDWAARAHTNQLNITVEIQGSRAAAAQLDREAKRISSSLTPME
jgi:hypothetical protein